MSRTSETPEVPVPTVRIVRGTPSDEELAALVTVLSSLQGGGRGNTSPPEQHWGTPPHVRHRYPRSWAASRLPR